jgi:predicted nucleic acid-binding protein
VSFFVDANVVLYTVVDGEYRDACTEVLAAIIAGADGRTSTAVLEEVWHVERSLRGEGREGLAERAYRIFTPLLPVTDDVFRRAIAIDAPRLGTNDRLHVGTCLANGIDTIITADRDFDSAPGLKRVDPLDERALRRLVRSA